MKNYFKLLLLILIVSVFSVDKSFAQAVYPYKQKFIITAYYSPLPDQSHYFRGDYEAEVRLNGRGTHGASGKPVYPGMIAAPKEYPFGTKMFVPGVGVVAVYDRGGAIKKADGKGRPYDRLDIWMGKGEEGLKRALAWGVRVVEVEIYGPTGPEESVNLDSFNFSDISRYKVTSKTFGSDVYYKSSGDDVRKLQEILKSLGYFDRDISGYYGDETREAVINFQIDHGVIQDRDDFGAGHFGINSRSVIDKVLDGTFKKEVAKENSVALKTTTSNEKYNRAIESNEKSEYVREVQKELVEMGFLKIEPTGYYGETTAHAIFKFQQSVGLIDDKTELAAGYFGPQTRAHFNKISKSREETKAIIASKSSSNSQIAKK